MFSLVRFFSRPRHIIVACDTQGIGMPTVVHLRRSLLDDAFVISNASDFQRLSAAAQALLLSGVRATTGFRIVGHHMPSSHERCSLLRFVRRRANYYVIEQDPPAQDFPDD